MSEQSSLYPELARDIAPAQGKLGVLLPGLGAVSTTLIAGVALIKKGLAQPIGSLTQLQKIRLGKRSNPRYSFIKDLVPMANLQDLVFGGWDIFLLRVRVACIGILLARHRFLPGSKPEAFRLRGVFHRRCPCSWCCLVAVYGPTALP